MGVNRMRPSLSGAPSNVTSPDTFPTVGPRLQPVRGPVRTQSAIAAAIELRTIMLNLRGHGTRNETLVPKLHENQCHRTRRANNLEIVQPLAAIHAAEAAPGIEGDIVGNATDSAIAHADVDAAGMPAACRLIAIGAGRARHFLIRPRDTKIRQ